MSSLLLLTLTPSRGRIARYMALIFVGAPQLEGKSRVLREMIYRAYCIYSKVLGGNTGDVSTTQGTRRIKD